MRTRKSAAAVLLVAVLCTAAPWEAASFVSLAGVDGCCPADARGGDPCAPRGGHEAAGGGAERDGSSGDDEPAPSGTSCDCCAPQRVAPHPAAVPVPVRAATGFVLPEAGPHPPSNPPGDVFHPPRLPSA